MKTVKDAVNKFSGYWPYPNSCSIVYHEDYGYQDWDEMDDYGLNPRWQFVCTREEFEQVAARQREQEKQNKY